MDKKKENKGSLISSIGGLFTIIGLTFLTLDYPSIYSLSCTTIGVVLAAYGVFVMFNAGKVKKDEDQ